MSQNTPHRPTTYIDIRLRDFSIGVAHKRGRKNKQRQRILILALLFFTVISTLLVWGFLYSRTSADVVLTPRTCLGGWKNASYAAGAPDVIAGNPSTYSDTNSASVSNMLADIFCGDFRGAIPKDTKPTQITVKFSWALIPQSVPIEISASPQDLASSTSAVLAAPSQSVGTDSIATTTINSSGNPTDTITSTSSAQVPQLQPTAVHPGQDEGATTPPTSVVLPVPTMVAPALPIDSVPTMTPSSPQSFIFVKKVLAWLVPERVYAETGVSVSSSSVNTDLSTTTITALVTNSTSISTSVTNDAIVEVSYTLDGTLWHDLGTVSNTLKTNTFTIPVEQIAGWDDLSKLQIRVRSLSGLSASDVVYLDGMTIDASYTEIPKEVKQTEIETFDLQDGSVFANNKQAGAIVHIVHHDGSTNVIFYHDDGTSFSYQAETLASEDLPLGQYYSPPPLPGKYVMIEYTNDHGSFDCNGFSLRACLKDKHFIRRISFEITESADTIATTTATTTITTTATTTTNP